MPHPEEEQKKLAPIPVPEDERLMSKGDTEPEARPEGVRLTMPVTLCPRPAAPALANSRRPANDDSERESLVCLWLREEVVACAGKVSEEEEEAARALGRSIYEAFMEGFLQYFGGENGHGERRIRDQLRNRFGFSPESGVEMVLNRIRDRRLELLQAFRRRYQPQLLGPQTFVAAGVRGYLKKVAWMEARKASATEMQVQSATDPDLLDTRQAAEEDEEHEGRSSLAPLLKNFWSPENGFKESHQLEGMVSLGLGNYTGHPELVQRWKAFLEERYPAWQEEQESLVAKVGRLLSERNQLEGQLRRMYDSRDRSDAFQQIDRLSQRLERLQVRLRNHEKRLFPRPQEVQQLLGSLVNRQGAIRYQRNRREIALFGERVTEATKGLMKAFGGRLPENLANLSNSVMAFRETEPPSTREHKISDAERAQRAQGQRVWRERGMNLLAEVTATLTQLMQRPLVPAEASRSARFWLADVQNLLELGLIDDQGVIGGLRTRDAWRLERMLRVGL